MFQRQEIEGGVEIITVTDYSCSSLPIRAFCPPCAYRPIRSDPDGKQPNGFTEVYGSLRRSLYPKPPLHKMSVFKELQPLRSQKGGLGGLRYVLRSSRLALIHPRSARAMAALRSFSFAGRLRGRCPSAGFLIPSGSRACQHHFGNSNKLWLFIYPHCIIPWKQRLIIHPFSR